MPAVTRLGDKCTGDGCLPSRPSTGANIKEVYCNNIKVHCKNDTWEEHMCGSTIHTNRTTIGGSGTVYIDNDPIARIGDQINCGASIAQGSGNVFAG